MGDGANGLTPTVARIRGLDVRFCLSPGAHAPGFILTPASQAIYLLFVLGVVD